MLATDETSWQWPRTSSSSKQSNLPPPGDHQKNSQVLQSHTSTPAAASTHSFVSPRVALLCSAFASYSCAYSSSLRSRVFPSVPPLVNASGPLPVRLLRAIPHPPWPAVGLQDSIQPLAAMTTCCSWRKQIPLTARAKARP